MKKRNIDGVIYFDLSEDLSDDAIEACQGWYEGMGCALYALQSSGLVRAGDAWRLRAAVSRALDLAIAAGEDTLGLEDLLPLLDDLDAAEERLRGRGGREDGHVRAAQA